jgi:hypothetical protein
MDGRKLEDALRAEGRDCLATLLADARCATDEGEAVELCREIHAALERYEDESHDSEVVAAACEALLTYEHRLGALIDNAWADRQFETYQFLDAWLDASK